MPNHWCYCNCAPPRVGAHKETTIKTANTQHTAPSSPHPNQHSPTYQMGQKNLLPHPNTNTKTTQTKKPTTPTTPRWDGKTPTQSSPQRTKKKMNLEQPVALQINIPNNAKGYIRPHLHPHTTNIAPRIEC